MASSSSLNSLLHPNQHHQHHRKSFPSSTTTFLSFTSRRSLSPKPLSTTISSLTTSNSTPITASPDNPTSLEPLARLLSSGEFRLADDETRRLLIALAGDAAVKRGYVFFSEVAFIPADDLREIDALWLDHSSGRFGYSVQRRLWEKSGRDFTRLFIRIGWMKKLPDSEVEQFSYRSFPEEFVWDLSAPEGHLPLTNALRGTQLLAAILTHPAFDGGDGGLSDSDDESSAKPAAAAPAGGRLKDLFKTDYSF